MELKLGSTHTCQAPPPSPDPEEPHRESNVLYTAAKSPKPSPNTPPAAPQRRRHNKYKRMLGNAERCHSGSRWSAHLTTSALAGLLYFKGENDGQ